MNPVTVTFSSDQSAAFIEYLKFSLNDLCVFLLSKLLPSASKPQCKMKILRLTSAICHFGHFEQKIAFLLSSVCLYGYCHTKWHLNLSRGEKS